ncbi:MAG TPA: peptidyl-prolyl cis-trans isomerase [Thermoleophilaceae bacterium]|nr:peptidyl-prolyl cis-trans isomerase [Thermoleophilaceae bacterium]
MTHSLSKLALAAATASIGAALVAGCGNDVPAGSVAKVGDETITKKDFDKWLTTAASGQSQGGPAVVPDPPSYERCVSAKGKQPSQSRSKPSEAQLKKQCKQEYDQLKGQVMQFLIQSAWVQQEADARGVKVSNAEVKRSLEDQKKQAFPNEKAYKKFLASSGMSEEDILFRVKLDQLQQKLTQKVTEDEAKVSDADIRQYYEKNKTRFAQPERRDLDVVLTKTKAKAEQAKRALDEGQSFKSVAKKYSIDSASKSQGGKLPDVAKGQQEKSLDKAVFAAKKGKLSGPVKTQFGWYVFEVTKVKKATQQSLGQARETIRNLLRSRRQQKALDSFIKNFREDYKDKTVCAEDYRIAECKNGPKEKTNTGPASGGAPGGGAPQQPPPSGGAPQAPPSGGGSQPPPSGGGSQGQPSP